MGLREKITEALADQVSTSDTIDAVMEVVEGRLTELEAEADRIATGDPWDFGYAQALKDMRGEET